MSADALNQEKASVLLDFQQTENEIAGLESQLRRMGELISTFGDWCKTNPANRIYKQDQAHHRHYDAQFVPDAVRKAMTDWQEAFGIADKLREARLKLATLKETKQRMGLR